MNEKKNPLIGALRPMRAVLLLGWIAAGLLMLALGFPVLGVSARGKMASFWSRGLLVVLGVRMRVTGSMPQSGALLVANHVSWIDPFLVLACFPVRFAAKEEIRHWPVFGWLVAQAGTVFIRRDRQRDVSRVARMFENHLGDGEVVALFPESTTGDGSYVRPFKSALFQVAVSQSVDCVPAAIQYAQRTPIWIDDMGFVSSIWRVLGQQRTDATLQFCLPIAASRGLSRRELARECEAVIARTLSLPVRNNLPETPGGLPA